MLVTAKTGIRLRSGQYHKKVTERIENIIFEILNVTKLINYISGMEAKANFNALYCWVIQKPNFRTKFHKINVQRISMANLWTIHSRAFFDDTIVTNEIAHSLFYPLCPR